MNHHPPSSSSLQMPPSGLKTSISASDFEAETNKLELQSHACTLQAVTTVRTALTAVALISGLASMVLAADALRIYQDTHVSDDFMLPLWPYDVDVRPTAVVVVVGALVAVISAVSMVVSRREYSCRTTIIHTTAAPLLSFVISLVATSFSYAVNVSPTSADTLQSWTCQWRDVVMYSQPYFGTLCRESEASLALMVVLVPLEMLLLGVAAWQVKLWRRLERVMVSEKVEGEQGGLGIA